MSVTLFAVPHCIAAIRCCLFFRHQRYKAARITSMATVVVIVSEEMLQASVYPSRTYTNHYAADCTPVEPGS